MISGSEVVVRVQMVENEGCDNELSLSVLSRGQGSFLMIRSLYEGVQVNGLKKLGHRLGPGDVVIITQFF